MITPKKYTFDVYHAGERAAGLHSFTDTVTVAVESGDPGGDAGEFEEFILQTLKDWYDGAGVRVRKGEVFAFEGEQR